MPIRVIRPIMWCVVIGVGNGHLAASGLLILAVWMARLIVIADD